MSRMRQLGGRGVLLVVVLLAAAGGYFLYASTLKNSGTIQLSATLIYEDGTAVQYPRSWLLGWMPESVVDQTGKVLSRIDYAAKVKVTWTGGEAASSSVKGDLVFSVGAPTISEKQRTPVNYVATLSSGSEVLVASGSLAASTLEGWSPATGYKNFELKFAPTVSVTLKSGPTITGSGSGSFGYSYEVEAAGITSLSVTVSGAPVSL